jgi:GNAT superfamily N-acetyltransferase
VVAYFMARGLPPAVDIDPVAESQGLGAAFRRLGATPVVGSRLLMHYPHSTPPDLQRREESVKRLALSVKRPTQETHSEESDVTLNTQRSTLNAQRSFTIEVVPNETGAGEARAWVETVVCDEEAEDLPLWQAVTEMEARSSGCRLYLARLEGQAAGACDLFSHAGWGRIDSVVTVPAWRRRGVASRLTARAVADSLALGNTATYLFTDAGGAGEQVYRQLGFTVWAVDVLRRHIRW